MGKQVGLGSSLSHFPMLPMAPAAPVLQKQGTPAALNTKHIPSSVFDFKEA